jgi:excisionase family DNA binding protein
MQEIIITPEDIVSGLSIKIELMILIVQGPPAKKIDFNLAEASKYIGVTERHLRDLCRGKQIGFSKPHYRTFRFRLIDLEKYLERKRKSPKELIMR